MIIRVIPLILWEDKAVVLKNLNELALFDWEKVKQQLACTLNAHTRSFCSVKNVNEQYTLHFKAYHIHLSMLNITVILTKELHYTKI